MKKTVLLMGLMILMNQGFAQEVAKETKELSSEEKEIVISDLEAEAKLDKHDNKTKRILKSVAKGLKETSQTIAVEVKALDDCVNCEVRPRTKAGIVLTNLGRKLGRGSAWLTTTTSKPFVNAASFLTGLFEKREKNAETIALYKFFLNHASEFDKLYLEASTSEEMIEKMLVRMGEIVELKSKIALREYLASIGIKRLEVSPEILAKLESFKGKPLTEAQAEEKALILLELSDIELTKEEVASIDKSKLSVASINANPSYQEVKGIIGDISEEQLKDVIEVGVLDKSISYSNYKAAMPKIHEGAIGLVGQMFAPKVALGVISKSLAGIYGTPVLLADIGTGISGAVCLNGETKAKFEKDKDLGSFCSYVVNRSAYQLMKSRAKGYVAGKKANEKLTQKIAERKERRAARREEKQRQRDIEDSLKDRPIH